MGAPSDAGSTPTLAALTPRPAAPEDARVTRRRKWHGAAGAGGAGLVEIALVLVVVAILGAVLYQYFLSTARTVESVQTERPLSQARLAADRATLAAIRSALQIYRSRHGAWPPGKDAVAALLNPPPAFQCEGNAFTYDPATGQVALLVDDLGRC